MKTRFAAAGLMLGNFIVGTSVLAPSGMLQRLASGLSVTATDIGLLITYGAVVLCFGSPLVSWATSRLDRRMVLVAILFLIALAGAASAFAPNYGTLLALRLLMMAAAAPFTPQAASTIALMVGEHERARAITFVFLGWSLSVAVGLPIVGFLADGLGWRATYGALAAASAVTGLVVAFGMPAGVRGAAMSLKSWADIGRDRQILLLLLLTAVQVAGQFSIFTYLAPLLTRLTGAGVGTIGGFFAIFGVAGFLGNLIATKIVLDIGPFRTSFLCLLSILLGIGLWSFGAGLLLLMGVGVAFWGLGFAAINSMQQARLVAAAPPLASGSVALNTSAIYVGQAIGSGLGGLLLAHDLARPIGYAGIAFILAAFAILATTRSARERVPTAA